MNEFLFWPPRPHIFRIACGYLLHSLIFPHSLSIFKGFGTQIPNTTVFANIFLSDASTFSYLVGATISAAGTELPVILAIAELVTWYKYNPADV